MISVGGMFELTPLMHMGAAELDARWFTEEVQIWGRGLVEGKRYLNFLSSRPHVVDTGRPILHHLQRGLLRARTTSFHKGRFQISTGNTSASSNFAASVRPGALAARVLQRWHSYREAGGVVTSPTDNIPRQLPERSSSPLQRRASSPKPGDDDKTFGNRPRTRSLGW